MKWGCRMEGVVRCSVLAVFDVRCGTTVPSVAEERRGCRKTRK